MSVAATQWAWQQALKPVAKLVLLALADRANDSGVCWPSVPRLVSDVGADRKTILAAIKLFETEALVRVARSPGGGNRYYLLIDQRVQQTGSENGTSTDFGTGTENGTSPVPKTGLPSTEYGTSTSTENGTLNLKDESNNNLPFNLPGLPDKSGSKKSDLKTNIEKQFEIAWSHYPARSGGNSEAKALKAFTARIKSGIAPQELIDGVIRYASWCHATGKAGTEFVKQASTFFGPDLHFQEPWAIQTSQPGVTSHATKRQQSANINQKIFSEAARVYDSITGGVSGDGCIVLPDDRHILQSLDGPIPD